MSSSPELPPNIALAAFVISDADAASLQQGLAPSQIRLTTLNNIPEFISWVEQHRHEIDGLILQTGDHFAELVEQLYQRAILLPAMILCPPASLDPSERPEPQTSPVTAIAPAMEGIEGDSVKCYYHQAEVKLTDFKAEENHPWEEYLDKAINDFLQLRAQPTPQQSEGTTAVLGGTDYHQLLIAQQHRLADKLRARLGYLGVYYKREPSNFFRYLSPEEQAEFADSLRDEYRAIIINYFDQSAETNVKIDSLVDKAFFADISVTKIVEIHIALIDELSKQLKLEGRSPEVLLDYRLTLIDVISHLGEMYRRSIPRQL